MPDFGRPAKRHNTPHSKQTLSTSGRDIFGIFWLPKNTISRPLFSLLD